MARVDRKPSLEDVCAYAAELRIAAQQVTNPDPANPRYRPYVPYVWSPSDEYARYLSNKHGPAKALEHLRGRAEQAKADLRRQEEDDREREVRERRRREQERRDAEELADGTPGRRIDAALIGLQLVSAGRTVTLDAEIRGSSEHPSRALLAHEGHEYLEAVAQALGLARKLERALERLRRSPLPPERVADPIERLRKMHGYSPEEVALMDPSQGLPRQIRENRAKIGLDPETGDPAGEIAA